MASDPQDASIATRAGCYYFARSSTFTLIYGIFVLLFLQSATQYLKTKPASRGQHWMFFITTFTFMLATINEAIILSGTGIYLNSAFVRQQNSNPMNKYHEALKLLTKPNFVYIWVIGLEVLISDCVIVWRAYVLLQHKRWLIVVPSFLVLCSFVLYVILLWQLSKYSGIGLNHLEDILSSAIINLSLATNVVATTLIGGVYWKHRKEMKSALGTHRATQVERILALLVESGIIFCLLQIIAVLNNYIIPAELDPARFYAYGVITATYFGFSALYPTAVISLVNSHRTFNHIYSLNTFTESRHIDVDLGPMDSLQATIQTIATHTPTKAVEFMGA